MEAAGAIGWAPQVFWDATPAEFWRFLCGWRRANGMAAEWNNVGVSLHEFDALKGQFPDRE